MVATTINRTKPPRRRKVRRAGALAPPPAAITLAIAPPHRFGWKDLAIFLAGVSVIALGLSAAYFAPRVLPRSEEVTLITVEEPPPPPPPPPEEIKPPPPPPPPPPDPDQPPPPPQPENAPPPPPQFGLPDEGTSENGSFSVARGNTLMKRPDSVVKPPPPPLPPAPIQLERAPAFLKAVPPEYPAWALEDGVEAAVQLMVTVDEQGRVTEASVLKSGGKDFDQAALRAVRASLFEPLVRGGKTLPSRFVQPYNFTLE